MGEFEGEGMCVRLFCVGEFKGVLLCEGVMCGKV